MTGMTGGEGTGPDAARATGTGGTDRGRGTGGTEPGAGQMRRDEPRRGQPPSREEIRQAIRSGLDPREAGRRPGAGEGGLRDLGFGDAGVRDADARSSPPDREDRGPRGDRLVLPPAADQGPASGASSFPSERELLRRPPFWQRTLRRLPVAVPGEGSLRKSPSVRERERHRALLRFVALVAVIVLVGAGLWVASMRDKSPTTAIGGATTVPPPAPVRVKPTGVTASTQSGSRIATNVIDNSLGTFWSRLVPSQDNQPSLRFTFGQTIDLGRLQIAAGASGSEFGKRPRPQEIELRFSDGSTLRTTLADQPAFQTVSFNPRKVNVVKLVILSTYPSSGPQRTSISEIRFFAAKS
jgi:hypothetical protein